MIDNVNYFTHYEVGKTIKYVIQCPTTVYKALKISNNMRPIKFLPDKP